METKNESKPAVIPAAPPETAPKPAAPRRSHAKKTIALALPEELLLLTLDDVADGSAPAKSMLRYGLAGAFLAELVRTKKIHVEEDRLTVAGAAPCGDALFDDILTMVTAENKPRKVAHWVQAVGSKLTAKQVAQRLVEHQVIVMEKKQSAWVVPYPAFPQVQASAKYLLKQHLRGIVLAGELASPTDIILLSLIKACRLQRLVFTRDERKFADEKLDELVQGELFGEAVAKVLAEK
jgi:golgi phosphoprotein 3